jgi:HSP20 family protein
MSALVPWRSMREMDPLSRRMDEMFDRLTRDFFGPRWPERSRAEAATMWEPAIECHLEVGNLIIKADLPGIDPKDVNISLLGTQLTIEGERKVEKPKEGEGYMYRELPYGKFSRVLTLPEGIDADKIKTAYKNGVLEISMPAPSQMVSKKIPIEVQK